MIEKPGAKIRKLTTGIDKLDLVLGGGIPEYSFNIIMGEPGSGKTTLAHQIVFANASAERPALYFTVLGEPTLKMLRYQQQFSFFDASKINHSIHFANLGEVALDGDLAKILDAIVKEIDRIQPAIVVVVHAGCDAQGSQTKALSPGRTQQLPHHRRCATLPSSRFSALRSVVETGARF